MFGLSDDEEIMMLALFVSIQYRRVMDGQTDGQTRRSRKDRAMHSVARVKIKCSSSVVRKSTRYVKYICKHIKKLANFYAIGPKTLMTKHVIM